MVYDTAVIALYALNRLIAIQVRTIATLGRTNSFRKLTMTAPTVRRQKDFIVSPYMLRKGAVVQWPHISFNPTADRFQGEIVHMTRQADGNVLITCHNVVNLTTGQPTEPDPVQYIAGVKVFSLSHVDKLVCNPSNAALLPSDAEYLKDVLNVYSHIPPARDQFTQLYEELNIAQWDENTPLDVMNKAVELYIQKAWSPTLVGHLSQEWLTNLAALICIQIQLKRRQPLFALLLKRHAFKIISRALNTKTVRKQQAKRVSATPTPFPSLPTLCVVRQIVKEQFHRLLTSRANEKRTQRELDAKSYSRICNKFYDYDFDEYHIDDDDGSDFAHP